MTVIPALRGGIGNCLFGVAAAISYSIKHNIYYLIPTTIENPHYKGQQVIHSPYLKYIDGDLKDLTGDVKVYNEPFFHYQEIPKFNCDYLILNGYFQSALYFNDYRTEILRLLNISYEYKEGYCSIHIRRTNYLNLPNIHPVVTPDYIEEAQIHMINQGIFKFIYVSDDIEFCKSNLPQFHECEYEFSEGRTEVEDISLASSCQHNIGSNSSFSFFIYWLNRNKNKIGIFPSKDKWFGKDLLHSVDDLYMPEWLLI